MTLCSYIFPKMQENPHVFFCCDLSFLGGPSLSPWFCGFGFGEKLEDTVNMLCFDWWKVLGCCWETTMNNADFLVSREENNKER
jgi:hypothetical protein